MTAARATWAAADRLAPRLGERDWQIIRALRRTRVLTGSHLSRLCFTELSPGTRDRTRRRVMARLTTRGVVTRLDRVIGGVRAGSTGWVYALAPLGVRLAARDAGDEPAERIRAPWTPSLLFLAHSLAISEVYVELTERAAPDGYTVAQFATEPDCWWPDGAGGYLKPDALIVLRSKTEQVSVWLEVDRGTESLPTVRRKLSAYIDFYQSRAKRPDDVMPYVVVAATTQRRATALRTVTDRLLPTELFETTTTAAVVGGLAMKLASQS